MTQDGRIWQRRDADRGMVKAAIGEPPEDGWRHIRCPLCETRGYAPDRKAAMSVSSAGYYECHRCAARGWLRARPRDYVGPVVPEDEKEVGGQLVEGIPLPEYFQPLYRWEVGRGRNAGTRRGMMAQYSANETAEEALKYLLQTRGIPEQALREGGVGCCTNGWYAGRVIAPITWWSYLGPARNEPDTIGWVARSVPALVCNAPDRTYLYPKGMNRAAILYNPLQGVDPDKRGTGMSILVEGVFDALAHAGIGALALLGKPSTQQIAALRKRTHSGAPIAVCLDGDALDDGWALAQILRLSGVPAGAIRLPPCTDPDEVPSDVLLRAAEKCIGRSEMVDLE